MDKLISLITNPGADDGDLRQHDARLRMAERLHGAGARRVQVNVVDDHVTAAQGLRIASSPAPLAAAISVWMDEGTDDLAPLAAAMGAPSGAVSTYRVRASEPLTVPDDRRRADGRVEGLAQIACIKRRPDLSPEQFLEIWQGSHTQIAIDTQDTFSYVQNVVTQVVPGATTAWDAIVEECFPPDAMADPHAFFDAVGDDDLLARRQQEMFESVQRFIDLASIDVVPTTRYDLS